MDITTITENVRTVADNFAQNRGERQTRRELDSGDFEQLSAAGLHLTGVLAEHGGLWKNVAESARPICNLLRIVATGDSSVALVCSMHPSVLSFWYATPQV